jgi:hypothetical protein
MIVLVEPLPEPFQIVSVSSIHLAEHAFSSGDSFKPVVRQTIKACANYVEIRIRGSGTRIPREEISSGLSDVCSREFRDVSIAARMSANEAEPEVRGHNKA